MPSTPGEDAARPGWRPTTEADLSYQWQQTVEVDGERFRIGRRASATSSDGSLPNSVSYDYDWLTGPNPGYGFTASGPEVIDPDEHLDRLRDFLAGIDPETGFLADS